MTQLVWALTLGTPGIALLIREMRHYNDWPQFDWATGERIPGEVRKGITMEEGN